MTAYDEDRTPRPAGAVEPTLTETDEPTLVEAGEPTLVLPAAHESAPTLFLGSTPHAGSGRVPGAEAGAGTADAEYSATVLASHWIQRPEPDETLAEPTVVQPTLAEATVAEETVEQPSTAAVNGATPPDRIDGTLLRFGPGVTNVVAQRTHRTLPALPTPRVPRRRRLRRHALPVLVLLAVLAFLAWQRLGPRLEVGTVTVTARPTVLKCDSTADIVAVVATNGRPGTFSYRWIRSDGTRSGVLEEVVVRGQRQARVHLRWTFQGEGHRSAQAELRILSADPRSATARFTYDCS
ncbi:hypothetical protein [Streptomyces griseiscabiei]|uniref:Ig-like domain-containing protein n=2 Tax=Streptomyces griseiscabiei TaxID=2993540 RepID=A0ABU4LD29_9ACTN|nr:hypothetical protein [Streptomyces griseiscabiei]MDX2913230.1 hypothetical protein [Streptomyces griseiscabiei]